MAKGDKAGVTQRRGYWAEQINKASRLYETFHTGGERVIDSYRIEKSNAANDHNQDRYNILYSSTETIRPSLYVQTPKVEVKRRHRDRKNPRVAAAATLLESCVAYAIEEVDFDDVLNNAIEDYALPGMGAAWVRYEPTFRPQTNDAGEPVLDTKGKPEQVLDYEALALDYVPWKDMLFGPARFWKELPWGARRVYMSKAKMTSRFGAEKANKVQYSDSHQKDREPVVEDKQCAVWEIWSKADREVIWYCDSYPSDVLDVQSDPLRLKDFWPFPKPLRAISNTRTLVPRPFYSQYQAQAEELNRLTQKIRFLTQALNVRGVYDTSQPAIALMLSPQGGNKMIPTDNWQAFMGQNGMSGSVQFLPIKEIAQVLMQLYDARERCKAEIYEITGFSDIVRGSSKASETLGAQRIKTDWASARLKMMQKEVQRFCRDIVRLFAEVISEHFTDESLALYSGFEVPPQVPGMGHNGGPPLDPMIAQVPEQPDPAQQAVQQFKSVVELLRSERDRCAQIGIETDSTILPDEEGERKDRMEFLSHMGSYLQQAGPMVAQYPEMRGLLGAMMMFSVRTFRASRPLEQEFEAFQDAIQGQPPKDPNDKSGEAQAKAQSAVQIAQMKEQAATQRHSAEMQFKDKELGLRMREIQAEADRASTELAIKKVELQIKQAELAIKQQDHQINTAAAQQDQELKAQDQLHRHATDAIDGHRQDRQFEAEREDAANNTGEEGLT